MNRFKTSLLIIAIIAQLAVPLIMIHGKYDVLKNGEEIKLRVDPIDPYDVFRGRYVSLWYDEEPSYEQRQGKYGILSVNEDGFATLERVVTKKPVGELYLVSDEDDYFYFPHDRYYMKETLAPMAEELLEEDNDAYVTIRIKGDNAVVSGLYVDGEPIEELLTSDENKTGGD